MPLSVSGAAILGLGGKSENVPADVVSTVFCTKVGMTSKEGVSTLERALLTCIARTFEGDSACMGTKTNLSCFAMSRKGGFVTASLLPQ